MQNKLPVSGGMSAMAHAGLIDVWRMLRAIVERQTPFAQIMITVGTAFFIVMAIEGIRTSILAMRRGAEAGNRPVPPETNSPPMAARADQAKGSRIYATKTMLRPAARPLRKSRPVTVAKRLTPAIRRSDKINSSEYSADTTSF
jgi:hypothetical protein